MVGGWKGNAPPSFIAERPREQTFKLIKCISAVREMKFSFEIVTESLAFPNVICVGITKSCQLRNPPGITPKEVTVWNAIYGC